MFSNEPTVCILIPTFNRRDRLKGVLNCINDQQKTIPFKSEIIVVVDGSTDGTLDMLKNEFNVYVVLGDGDWWFTKCLNKGIEFIETFAQKPEYILILNDDTLLSEDYLTKMLDKMKTLPQKSILGSVSVASNNHDNVTFSGIRKLNRIVFKNYYFSLKDWNNVDTHKSVLLPTRGMLFPYALLNSLGGFDESFPQYGSDYDFVLRAKRVGYDSYITNITKIMEFQELTSSGNPRINRSIKNYFRQVFSNKYSSNFFRKDLLFQWKHGFKLLAPFYVLTILLRDVYVFIKYRAK